MGLQVLVLKTGNIATSLVVELLLDERADRDGLDVDVLSTGAKMGKKEAERLVGRAELDKYDLIIYITPNPSVPGPKKVIEHLKGKRAIVIGDAPGMKIKEKLEELGLGYIFILGDSMIGARREFLDPVEMAIFNADMLKVLAVTGALRVVQEEIDRALQNADYLPRIVVDSEEAIERAGFFNSYARAKAMASYEMAKKVGELNVKGCFMIKEPDRYISIVASAHELLRNAAELADYAREMEKSLDGVLRKPHAKDGSLLEKRKLLDKPE